MAHTGDGSDVAGSYARAQWALEVSRALATLPADQRAVLELCYLRSMSQPAIARVLGVPIANVRWIAAGALSQLGRALAVS